MRCLCYDGVMFVRTKKSLKTNNTAIQIVENLRADGTTKQRVVRHIGTASADKDINCLKQIAETIKGELESKSLYQSKINVSGQYGRLVGKTKSVSDKETVHIVKLEETNRSILGIHDVYGYIYDLLEFTNPFSRPARREHSAEILREIVLCRIAYPSSKRGAVEKLNDAFGVSLNLDRVYQMMDKIDNVFCDRIQ